MWEGNNLMVKGLLNGVTVNLHVLNAFVVDKIENNLDGTSVVSMHGCRLNLGKAKLCEKTLKPNELGVGNKHGAETKSFLLHF